MFKLYGDRESLWQWDLNQKLIVEDATCNEVHFCNGVDECSLVCLVYELDGQRVVDIPNIILQGNPKANKFEECFTIYVFTHIKEDESCRYTEYREALKVKKRSKPADYIYTETEVLNYRELEAKVEELSKEHEWRLLQDITLEEDVNSVVITEDSEGNGFELSAYMITLSNVVIGGVNANVFLEASGVIEGSMRIGILVGANCWTTRNFNSTKNMMIEIDDKFAHSHTHIVSDIQADVITKYNIDALRKIGIRVANATLAEGFTGLIGAGTNIKFYGKDI